MSDSKSKHTPARSWLWPDRTIGKRESRALREEHNALVNVNAALLAALEGLHSKVASMNNRQHAGLEVGPEDWADLYHEDAAARAALAKARGE